MARPAIQFTADMSPDTKRRLMSAISPLSGLYDVRIEPKKNTRSLAQNAFLWSAINTPFSQWIEAEWEEPCTPLRAHSILKEKLLRETKVHPKTGEAFDYTLESHDLSVERFSRFIEDAIQFLSECGIVVADPGAFGFSKDRQGIWRQPRKDPKHASTTTPR